MPNEWSPSSWREKNALQLPEYADPERLAAVEAQLRNSVPLVLASEVRSLKARLAQVARGKGR